MRYLYLMLIPALMLAGCKTPTDENTAGDALKRDCCSTPGRTLEQMARTWNITRDAGDYADLLTWNYQFYFDPCIIIPIPPQTGYEIPQFWTWQEDVSATGNMFAQAYNIQLDVLNAADFDDPDIPGEFYVANNVLIQFYLWPENGDYYYFTTGPCDFEFMKVGDEWLISAWYDRTGGTESGQSIGELRFAYR